MLGEEPGANPVRKAETVCSTIRNGKDSRKNFLSPNTIKAVEQTLNNRGDRSSGLMEQDRLYNNLLSSQPLCFNFFGEFMMNTDFGLKVLKTWWPELTGLQRVMFEYAPSENYTQDHSAFDIAFEVMAGKRKGLIGLECKYTDTFSAREYKENPAYKKLFAKSDSFPKGYDVYTQSRYNQLFRNQLIAEGLLQHGQYDFVHTGLFCFQQDMHALKIADEFRELLRLPASFSIITYSDFIEAGSFAAEKQEQQNWIHLLWARYCALELSEEFYSSLAKNL